MGYEKRLLTAVEHKLRIDYPQTLPKSANNNTMPLITIPIDIGENTFTTLCLLEHRGSVQHCFIHHPSMPTVT